MIQWISFLSFLVTPSLVSALLSQSSTITLSSRRPNSLRLVENSLLSTTRISFPPPTTATTTIHGKSTPLSKTATSTTSTTSTLTTTTSLAAVVSPIAVMDFSGKAVSFFQSLRVPSALIAGSSLTALFIRLADPKKHNEQTKSKIYWIMLYLYHILSSLSLLLSLNVIVTATAASNTILVGGDYETATSLATTGSKILLTKSMLEFLRQKNLVYEFLTTRWSFYVAILCFLKAITCRTIIEFDLLRKDRRRSAFFVMSCMIAFMAHVLHLLNDCVYLYPNLFLMTIGLFQIYLQRVFTRNSIMLKISFTSCLAALGLFVSILPEISRTIDQAVSGSDSSDDDDDDSSELKAEKD